MTDDLDMCDAIRVAIRRQWPELFREKKHTGTARLLPRGVYREKKRGLIAQFYRRVEGRQVAIFVARGEPGDFSPATAERLGRACASAAATWDEAHGR